MTMGGKMVEGEIVEAAKARQIYQDIVRRRRDPGLLEYMGRGLFRARVFPIEPHADLTIRLTFQQILRDDGGTLEWRYPLSTDRLNGAPVENALVHVRVKSHVDLKGVYSPSHDIAVVRKGNREADVSYERAGRRQDRDFLLYVNRSPDDVGFSLVSHKAPGEDGTFLAVIAPSTDVPDDRLVPKDVVYVLDTSGSMAQDGKIDQARKALEYGVRTLRSGDRFDIVSFAGQVRPFRDGLVDASPEMKDAAARWLGDLRAAGGTNVEGALQEALAMGQEGRLFMVVFITDGRPTIGERDADRLLAEVKQHDTAHARVFTFGVGFDLDVSLLDRIAEGTNAARDYVMPQEDLEVVTSRFFRKVSQPVLGDVHLELGSGIHDVYPSQLPDLFAGGQVVVLGRYEKGGDRVIRLKGRLGGREVTYEYEGTLAGGEAAPWLPRLWAQRKVAFLLDEIRLHGEDKELVDEVVRLATRYGIVTPYTAGLVVEESELAGGGGRGRVDRLDAGEGLVRRLRGEEPPSPSAPMPPSGAPAAGAVPAPATPPAERAARDSDELARLKEAAHGDAGETDADASRDGLEGEARERVQTAGDKTFLRSADGRWIDTAWDGKGETTKVEMLSDAWMELAARAGEVPRYLALGDHVVFVLDGKVWEVVPPAATGG
jgi:Ca-activated chloride channel homolog